MNNSKMWLPTSVKEIFESFSFDSTTVSKKNIAYNIQYLQFLSKNIDEVETTTVLYRMRYKTFIIVSMSIIEAVFIALLEERNLIPYEEWKDGKHHKKQVDDDTIEVSFIRKRIDKKKKKISFDEAIHLIKSNNLLDLTEAHYHLLDFLKDMRNHIHLNKAQELFNSDYNMNNDGSYILIRSLFYKIMSNKIISKNIEYLEFIKCEDILYSSN